MIFIQPSIVNSARTLQDIQADMDARYRVSGDSRTFADGPGVLPGVDEIPRADPRGKNRSKPAPAAGQSTESLVKPSLRPAHRR